MGETRVAGGGGETGGSHRAGPPALILALAPMTQRPLLELRSRIRSRLRDVFDGRGFVEVDTPVLSTEVLPEAHIDPIVVHVDGPDAPPHYLQASPEALMKRLLAGGAGPIYQ